MSTRWLFLQTLGNIRLTTESYVTITSFNSGPVFEYCCPTDAQYTAENITDHLKAAAEERGMLGKMCACVHDNTSNKVVANERLLELELVPSLAHTLQLAINNDFKGESVNRLTVAG